MIDLHVHTTASDGQYTPSEIVRKAFEKKMTLIAITDHDTIDGLDEGEKEAEKLGILFVRGIEISINRPGCEFHLLGLGLKQTSESLKKLTAEVISNRFKRNEEIIAKINSCGIPITHENLQKDFPNTVIGRPHIAEELIKMKIVKTRQQAFDQYLAKGRSCYVDIQGADFDEAIQAINESGGVPVLAHPMSLFLSWSKLPDFITDLKERGLKGVEAYHPGARRAECSRLDELAKSLGLFITAGSDFHGEKIRADRRLGHTCKDKKIEDSFWFDELKPALEKNNQ